MECGERRVSVVIELGQAGQIISGDVRRTDGKHVRALSPGCRSRYAQILRLASPGILVTFTGTPSAPAAA